MKSASSAQKIRSLALALVIGLVFLAPQLPAQSLVPAEKPPLRERMFFGGTFWLSFGNVSNIEIAPIVGLWVLPRLAVAGGPEYQFFKYYDQKTSIYGGKAYAQFVLLKDLNNLVPLGVHTGIFLHVEDELLSLDAGYWPSQVQTSGRFTVNTVLAGGGISQQLGRRSSINFIIIWALNDAGYGVYDNPEIRLSFNF